ncbi:MAG: pilin [Candidatus Gracilibacteria bacterium]|jgi:hypothetical protein
MGKKTQTKTFITKLLIGFSVFAITMTSFTQITLAGDPPAAETAPEVAPEAAVEPGEETPPSGDATAAIDTSSLESFDVGDYLKVTDAEDPNKTQGQDYMTNTQYSSPIIGFALIIIDFLIKVIGTVCVVFIIVGGVLMMSSQGDDSRIQKGKTIITQAIIGLIIAFSSYILVSFVQSLLYVAN